MVKFKSVSFWSCWMDQGNIFWQVENNLYLRYFGYMPWCFWIKKIQYFSLLGSLLFSIQCRDEQIANTACWNQMILKTTVSEWSRNKAGAFRKCKQMLQKKKRRIKQMSFSNWIPRKLKTLIWNINRAVIKAQFDNPEASNCIQPE